MSDISRAVGDAVRKELAAVTEEVRQAVSAEQAQKLNEFESAIVDLRAHLAKLEARGDVKPTEEKVSDIEKRLAETEENVRIIRAHPALPSNRKDDVVDVFRGVFIRDIAAAKRTLRELRGMEQGPIQTRSIDSGLFVTGGKLPAEAADQFIDFLIEQQNALSRVVVRRMMNPEGHTDELTVAARKMRKGAEGSDPTAAGGIGTKRRTLRTVEVIWAEDITLTFLEDNIERRGAETHIARMLATAFGNDLNDLAWNGDEADTGDAFRSINDGWLAIAAADTDVNVVDLSDTTYGVTSSTKASEVLSFASHALPFKFKGRTDLAYFVPVRFAERYADEVATRETALGDGVLVNGMPTLRYFGRAVIPEPHLYGSNNDKVVLTPLGNLFFGVQRQLTVDSEWRPRRRMVEYTITARTDYEYATGEAFVLVSSLPAHLQAV
jgi:hypothetical protein